MLSKMSGKPRELSWQSNLDRNKPKWHKFQFCAKKIEFFKSIVGYTELVNSNMLPEFLIEPR